MWNRRKTAGLMVMLVLLSLLGGCGKKEKTEPAPELLTPLSVSQSFRPVGMREVGGVKYLQGRVLAKEYAHFFEKNTLVKEILVDYGDVVQEGDVIARADTRDKEAAVQAASEALDSARSSAAFRKREYEAQTTLMEYRRMAAEAAGNPEGAAAVEQEKRIAAENYRYDSAVAENDIYWLEKNLEKAREEMNQSTLVARHSGRVTYVADLTMSSGENGPDSVLILISDFDDLYIEAIDDGSGNPERKGKPLPTNKYSYRAYDYKYTVIGGKRYPIEEMDYSLQEQRMIKTKESYPAMRFKAGDAPLAAGSSIPLYFSWKTTGKPVLAVGLDSVQTEGEVNYVYVRANPGSEELERRVITIGAEDGLYAEVLSGLEEGEEVYYDAGSVLPTKYEEREAELGRFTRTSASERVEQGLTKCDFYYSPNVNSMLTDGTKLREGNPVEEGAYLYTYMPATSDSELMEASQAISSEERRHTDAVNGLNAEIAELDRALAVSVDTEELLQNGFLTATDTDAEEKEEILYSREKLSVQRVMAGISLEEENAAYSASISRLRKEYDRLNSISGAAEVTAKSGGKVRTMIEFYDPVALVPNSILGIIATADNPLLQVTMMPMTSKSASAVEKMNTGGGDAAIPGQKLRFKAEGVDREVTCVGINGDADKLYVTTIGERVYLSKAAPRVDSKYNVFYTDADEEVLGAQHGIISFDSVDYPDVLLIPSEAVYSETSKTSAGTRHYVWRIMPYGLDKTYVDVEIGEKTAMVLTGLSEHDRVAVEVLEK